MTGRDRDDADQPRDALRDRYLEASAQDTQRPAAHVRAAVLAHAHMQLAQASGFGADPNADPNAASPATKRPPAANQSRWKISLLASVVLAGLTGLLVLQFERGTSDEKEVALGQKPAYESAAPSPLPSPEPESAPEATPPPVAGEAAPRSNPPPATAQSARAVAPEPRQTRPSAAQAPATSAAPLPAAPSPFPASPQSPSLPTAAAPAGLADTAPALTPRLPRVTPEAGRADESVTGSLRDPALRSAPPAPAPAPALAPAPVLAAPAPAAPSPSAAARAQAPLQKQNSFSGDAARGRADSSSGIDGSRASSAAANASAKQEATTDAKTALQQAARNGSVAQLERLIAQGVPLQSVLNAPDAAGRTPLVLAVINGHAALVQRLLALGANPALVDQGGMNALQHARQRGRGDIAALIEAAQ